MKFIVALAAFTASTSAIATTNNVCDNEEGATWLGSCHSLWYKHCDNFTLLPSETCNIETLGDASISWFSDSIEVSVWSYVMKAAPVAETEPTDPNSSDSSPSSDTWGRLMQDDTTTTAEKTC